MARDHDKVGENSEHITHKSQGINRKRSLTKEGEEEYRLLWMTHIAVTYRKC
jgi:hypothetical protein